MTWHEFHIFWMPRLIEAVGMIVAAWMLTRRNR